MFYGIIFPHTEQYITIHDELTTYVLPEKT